MAKDTIFILGDNHGRFGHIVEAVKQYRPAAVISVGDLAGDDQVRPLQEELREILSLTQFWWVHGNHDTDSDAAYDATFESALADRNLHGKVVNIFGYRVAGLGGVFRSQVWMPPEEPRYGSSDEFLKRAGKGNRWRGGLPRRHRSTIFPDTYRSLERQRADVLIAHEAPSCHPHGFHALDQLTRALGANAAFHGHHHDCLDYSQEWQSLRFRAHGVGLRGISDIEGNVIVPGDLD